MRDGTISISGHPALRHGVIHHTLWRLLASNINCHNIPTPAKALIRKGVLAGKNVSTAYPAGIASGIPCLCDSIMARKKKAIPNEITNHTWKVILVSLVVLSSLLRVVIECWLSAMIAPRMAKESHGISGYVPVSIRWLKALAGVGV